MAILKIKDETGKFVDIPAIQGPPGKNGAIQYEAGENIKIDGNVISATGGNRSYVWDMTNGDEAKAMFQSWLNDYYTYNTFPNIIAHQTKGSTRFYPTINIGFEYTDKKIYLTFGYYNQGYPYNQLNYMRAILTLDTERKTIVSISSETLLSAFYPLDRYQYHSGGGYTALDTKNTKAYTPTGDYNPATKKYVDDAIATLKAELTGTTE